MDKEEIRNRILAIYHHTPGNTLTEDLGAGSIFDEPVIGFGSADDPLFQEFKMPGVIGPWYRMPAEWLPGARSVVSVFYPFSAHVRSSNAGPSDIPSKEWLQGRIEGQAFVASCMTALCRWLEEQGISAEAPGISAEFCSFMGADMREEYPDAEEKTFGSNWSERHAAYVCGLGTFGLSKGLITRKGMAGRFGSVVTELELPPDERPYSDIYEYCTGCGACIRRCPVNAISMEEGKRHGPCLIMMKKTKELYAPRLGCGKCQTGVPCESGIPGR